MDRQESVEYFLIERTFTIVIPSKDFEAHFPAA